MIASVVYSSFAADIRGMRHRRVNLDTGLDGRRLGADLQDHRLHSESIAELAVSAHPWAGTTLLFSPSDAQTTPFANVDERERRGRDTS